MNRGARPQRVVAALLLSVAAAVSAPACLDDLPPARVCPPPPVHEAGDLTPVFQVTAMDCMNDHPETIPLEAILAGPRESCACAESECPTAGADCYPDGDCPPEVIAAAGEGARCIRLAPEDFGFGNSEASQCMCGCARCASVCDGQGPVIGALSSASSMYAQPAISLAGHVPSSGKIGVYVRARGISNTAIAFVSGDYADQASLVTRSVFFMTTPLDEFSEQVFYGADFLGNTSPYAWTDEAGRPDVLLLLNSVPQSGSQLTFYELDCVIPFVVP